MEIAVFIGFLVLLRFIIRNTKVYNTVLAVILMLIAIPVGVFVEIGLNGCCGAPSTGKEGIGYVAAAVLFISGLILLVVTVSKKR
jgi:hypothetical protein